MMMNFLTSIHTSYFAQFSYMLPARICYTIFRSGLSFAFLDSSTLLLLKLIGISIIVSLYCCIALLKNCSLFMLHTVVIWDHLLGDLQWGKRSICWSGPPVSGSASGEWAEAG